MSALCPFHCPRPRCLRARLATCRVPGSSLPNIYKKSPWLQRATDSGPGLPAGEAGGDLTSKGGKKPQKQSETVLPKHARSANALSGISAKVITARIVPGKADPRVQEAPYLPQTW